MRQEEAREPVYECGGEGRRPKEVKEEYSMSEERKVQEQDVISCEESKEKAV